MPLCAKAKIRLPVTGNRIAMNAAWDRWLAILTDHRGPEELDIGTRSDPP